MAGAGSESHFSRLLRHSKLMHLFPEAPLTVTPRTPAHKARSDYGLKAPAPSRMSRTPFLRVRLIDSEFGRPDVEGAGPTALLYKKWSETGATVGTDARGGRGGGEKVDGPTTAIGQEFVGHSRFDAETFGKAADGKRDRMEEIEAIEARQALEVLLRRLSLSTNTVTATAAYQKAMRLIEIRRVGNSHVYREARETLLKLLDPNLVRAHVLSSYY